MNKDLQCNIHKNCPILFIDMLQASKKTLQCAQCVSNKIEEISFIYIPQVTNIEENLFLNNWPPISDNQLRKKIIQLKNENEDVIQKVIDFYDQLTQEIIKIISEKKKEQLIAVEKTLEFKLKIVDQYCKMASLNKINQFLVNESQKYEEIEKALKEQIDSQYNRIDEYTTILQSMIKQYELISKFNIQESTQIKDNVIELVKIINLFPSNNFDVSDEMLSLDNLAVYQKKLDQEYEINKKDNVKIELLINQLDICNKQLSNKINQLDWYLDDYLSSQQILIAKYQIEKAEFTNELQKIQKLSPKDIIYSSQNNSQNYIQAKLNSQGKILIQRIKSGSSYNECYINYVLKPQKKYLFRINLFQSKNNFTFNIGLNQYFNSYFLNNNGMSFQIQQLTQNQNQENQIIDPLAVAKTLEFRVCIQEQLMEYRNYPNYTNVVTLNYKKSINTNGQYYLGIQFTQDYLGDKLEIFDIQELDQFPNN
ncbi:hypothetical protein ABPG74_006600 [Tetrahymena malaccensis]